MSFHLRHFFNIEVATITTIVLSVALIVYVLLSIYEYAGWRRQVIGNRNV